MAEVKLPEIGEGIESGDVLEVLVKEGDVVKKGQGVVELETDKATIVVDSTQEGKITKIHVGEGDTVKIGQTILTVEAADGAANEEKPAKAPPTEEKEQKEEKAEAKEEKPKPAPKAEKEEQPKEKKKKEEHEEEPAPAAKKQAPRREEKAPAKERQLSAADRERDERRAEGAKLRTQPLEETGDIAEDVVPASPAVRRFAREVGVNLAEVRGTGEGGRITREDVLEAVRRGGQSARETHRANGGGAAPARSAPRILETPEVEPPGEASEDHWGAVRIEKLPRIRRTIAERMHQSWSTIPRVTNFDDADVTELEKIRTASKADYAAAGVKLTTMPFVIKSVAQALRGNPLLNASIDLENGQIIYKQYYNIGIAVDTERGLVVPSLRNADDLSISEIARELAALADRVRSGRFDPKDTQGSTFTISNMGAIGGTYSTPVINLPEVAILLIGRSRKMPVVRGEEVKVRLMMPLSLSYDHRLVDGAVAARFLNDVISYLEAPSRLLLAP
jgi:pyruvate dehydrogenase E2 component (dihydrolipoamide acetyltransferase)